MTPGEGAAKLREREFAASIALDGLSADFQLVTEFRKFDLVAGPTPTAEVEFSARLLGADGKVAAAKVFQAEEPAKGVDAASAAAAIDAAFGKLAVELVVWASNAMRGAMQG